MSTFTLTTQSNNQGLSPLLRARYVWTADQVASGVWALLAGFPAVPAGGLALAIDATEAMRVAVRTTSTPLAGGDPVQGYMLPVGARETLFIAPDDVIYIRTP